MILGKLTGRAGLRPLGHRFLAGKISEKEVIERLRAQRDWYYDTIDEPLIVESNGRFWMLASVLHRVWPGIKVAGIIRDPRDWIESWKRHQPKRHQKGWFGWFPLGPLTPADVGDIDWVDRWDALDQFGRLAWDWRAICQQLERAEREAPNVRIFRFEDLFSADPSGVRDLVEFVANHEDKQFGIKDLDGFTGTVHNASSGAKRDWRNWPLEDVKLLDELCGELMRKHGYGQEPEWKELVASAYDRES